jgi:hypothetical protein
MLIGTASTAFADAEHADVPGYVIRSASNTEIPPASEGGRQALSRQDFIDGIPYKSTGKANTNQAPKDFLKIAKQALAKQGAELAKQTLANQQGKMIRKTPGRNPNRPLVRGVHF